MAGREVPMSVRRAIVDADVLSLNVAEFCRMHGVSRWFFYELRRRYVELGDAALEPRSRAPRRPGNRTDAATEELVVRTRKELADDGLDHGPASIKDLLGDRAPSESTIWRLLGRRGLIVAEPRKAPPWSGRRFEAERSNECWQIDATHALLADGTVVEIINVIDDHSRLCCRSLAVAVCTTSSAFDAITQAAERFGWPERVLSDNGSAFRGSPAQPTVGGLAAALHELGIATRRSRPFHPQTCGKVERFHQTQALRLAARPAPDDLDGLQTLIDDFAEHYNTRRKHRSIGRRTPLEIWTQGPRSGPADRPIGTDTIVLHSTVRRGMVYAGRRRPIIAVGNRYEHQTATLIMTDRNCHVFIDGHCIRSLTIDPSRDYQPLYDRPGRPDPTRLL